MSDDGVVDYDGDKVDEMALVDFIAGYIYKQHGNSLSPEVVRQVMMHVTEAVIENVKNRGNYHWKMKIRRIKKHAYR
jgi:hypothetical protein